MKRSRKKTPGQIYAVRSAAFIREAGRGFVIRGIAPEDQGTPTPAQWKAWLDWFYAKGIPTTFARKRMVYTVPCEWPEQFDPSWPASDKAFRFPPLEINSAETPLTQYRRWDN